MVIHFSSLIPVAIIFEAAVFVGVLFLVYTLGKKKREALQKLAQYLPGSVTNSFIPAFKGEYQGLKFSVSFSSGDDRSQNCLVISVIKTSFFKLSIYKESAFTSIGKRIGIIHEVKVNDEAFDKEFLIFSSKPLQVLSYLNNRSIKDAVRAVFLWGADSFMINGKEVVIRKPDYKMDEDLQPQKIRLALEKLSVLSRGF